MDTKHKIRCKGCDTAFRKFMEQMEELPSECPVCESHSFEIEPVEIDDEPSNDYDNPSDGDKPVKHQYDITHIEEMEQTKRSGR